LQLQLQAVQYLNCLKPYYIHCQSPKFKREVCILLSLLIIMK
jgi:hypothetical protein